MIALEVVESNACDYKCAFWIGLWNSKGNFCTRPKRGEEKKKNSATYNWRKCFIKQFSKPFIVYLWLQFKHRNTLTLHLVIKHYAKLARLSI